MRPVHCKLSEPLIAGIALQVSNKHVKARAAGKENSREYGTRQSTFMMPGQISFQRRGQKPHLNYDQHRS